MVLLEIQIDGFQKLFQGLHPLSPSGFELQRGKFCSLSPQLMGFRTFRSKNDGFLGTHRTHANGPTVIGKESYI